jgi:hypothetical protein
MGVQQIFNVVIIETFLGDQRHPVVNRLEEFGGCGANFGNVPNEVHDL